MHKGLQGKIVVILQHHTLPETKYYNFDVAEWVPWKQADWCLLRKPISISRLDVSSVVVCGLLWQAAMACESLVSHSSKLSATVFASKFRIVRLSRYICLSKCVVRVLLIHSKKHISWNMMASKRLTRSL